MSEEPRSRSAEPAFQKAISEFRQDIGGFRTLPRPSRTLPRLTLKHRYTGKLVAVLCMVTLVTAGVYVAPRLAGSDTVPAELVGRWATTNPGYEGRQLALTRDSLILRASVQDVTGYSVRRVERRQTAAGSTYVITAYSEPGGEYNLTLEYREEQQTIALGNPVHVVWHRAR